ncbi:MAG: gliding motility-associated C-terminal domain-containing protein [Flavobacteriales bacterium]
MRKIYLSLVFGVISSMGAMAQLTCSNDVYADTTSYTNGLPNDSLFFVCQNQTATLVATPESGATPWDFAWFQFDNVANSWAPLATVNDQTSSSQTNLLPDGYRVIITDNNGVVVGEYISWVVRQVTNPNVNVFPIAPGCGDVQLSALVINGSTTGYYNPPTAFDPQNTLLVDATTTITVCFTGNHTFVSDLAFHLIGPTSCGSPDITLSPNPGTNCNLGDNINNLCFTTIPGANFNVCTAAVPLSGTYSSYGATVTPIDWSGLYGCDASQAGWKVQIWDCVGADIGSLTDATLTFTGESEGGDMVTYTYTTPSGFNSAINDNSCNSATASTYTVPAPPPVLINFQYGYLWTADPPFDIPNNTSSLSILLSPGPTVDTYFTLELTGSNPGAVCGGADSNTELFDYAPPPTIDEVENLYCTSDNPITLTSPNAGGTWSGQGITNGATGAWDPEVAGGGVWTISYTMPGSCTTPATIEMVVLSNEEPPLANDAVLCQNGGDVDLDVTIGNTGTWAGEGIVNAATGLFSPSLTGEGTFTVTYTDNSLCAVFGSYDIVVASSILPEITSSNEYCENQGSVNLTASTGGGVWSGEGVSGDTFDPSQVGPGSYDVTYSITGNCPAEDTETFVVDDVNDFTITVPESICTDAGNLTLIASLPGGTWSGDGVSGNTFDPVEAGVGNNTVTYSFDDVCNSSLSDVILVILSGEVTITSGTNACVNGGLFYLSADVPGGTWSGEGVTSDYLDPMVPGVGQVTITYEIAGACPATDTEVMNINAAPTVNAGNNVEICEDDNVSLLATGATSYVWSPGSGLSSTTVANPTASPNSTTTYTVTGTDNNLCSSTDQVTVTVNQNPVVTAVALGDTPICQGEEIELQVNGLTSANWTPAATLTGANTLNPTANPNSTQQYTVTGEDENGCPGSATVTVTVTIVNANFDVNPNEGLSPVDVVMTNNSNGEVFNWNFGNGNELIGEDEGINPEQTYVEGGTYTITLTAFIDDCSATSTETVFVFFESEIVKIPNIITPNGSNGNEVFRIEARNMETVDVRIFNRWGKEMGAITTANGFWSPGDAAEGTYYYVLSMKGFDDEEYERQGYFTIVR